MPMTTEEVWVAFSAQLRSYIRHQAPDDAVDDILQEVFLRVHAHGATVRAQETLSGWLYQVTRNAISDHYRMLKGNPVAPLPPDAAERYAMPEVDLTDVRIQALLPCVRTMVQALPEPYREALLLTEYDGLSQKALGERLRLSFSGAKTRVQRAREKLRTLLLACCHLEFDHAGRVMDYHPGCASCSGESCAGAEGCVEACADEACADEACASGSVR